MAYLIHRGKPVADEIRRVLVEQNYRALRHLESWRENPREHVHQARRGFKRIRSLLRLVRADARYVYRVENACYRDLARSLADMRDAEAVIEAIDLLQARFTAPLAHESLHMLRIGLAERAERALDVSAPALQSRIDAVCTRLHAAEKRLPYLPLQSLHRRGLRRGAQKALAHCDAAAVRARRRGTAEDFHAWRKAVKHACHHAQLLRQIMPRWVAVTSPALGRLVETLGYHHDMVVLEALLGKQADELDVDLHLRAMRRTVAEAKTELAHAALVMLSQ